MKYQIKGWGNMVKLEAKVDWELKAKLYQKAAEQGVSLSEFVRRILEKQLPKTPKIEQDVIACHDTFYCPNCCREIGDDYLGMTHVDRYCHHCGQAIEKGGSYGKRKSGRD